VGSGIVARSTSVEFTITRSFPSHAVMVAPSPDWFAGVRSLALLEGRRDQSS
jgi:hypothetical protein